MNSSTYESPFTSRYSSPEMQYLFSPDKKFRTFRLLWISLAKAEQKLGLNITDEQIAELEATKDDIDYTLAAEYEKALRHDVMAHIHAWGDICPKAKGIIHLGATSCYVDDNTDVIIMAEALELLRGKLLSVLSNLCDFALKYKSLPALAYTHLQPAQLTTVGKRASLWAYELYLDLCDLDYVKDSLRLLGQKGTTGTQASFMELFGGDSAKVAALEELIAADFGMKCVPVSGQTYSRKYDSRVLNVLSGIAQSAYKFAQDMRLLQSFKELEEPYEKSQIGSSAMPYKRNPMRCERICALSRYIMCDAQNAALTASCQMFERTLDDSANKRVSVAEAFLAADAILDIYTNVTSGIVVYEKVIRSRVMAELPFMASENILMDAVKRGGDRQALHEVIRRCSIEAGKRVKEEGEANDMIDRLCKVPELGLTRADVEKSLVPEDYTGLAAEQTEKFFTEIIKPLLEANAGSIKKTAELKV